MALDFAVHPPKQKPRRWDVDPIPDPDLDKLDKLEPKILIQRIIQKEVTEWEAEILIRNGWEKVATS